MAERTMLMEVKKDGQELVLLDGRRLLVNPGDTPTCCTWLPTDALEISETNDGSMFSVEILSVGSDELIRGMWLG